jgi:aminoglycoside phosphotransferase (APT) family kinase protein
MTSPPSGTRPVRPSHAFDEDALARYLTTHVRGFQGPLAVWQYAGGQSNPTFLLQAASGEYVLRKKPPGTLLPSAHQIEREYRVMSALAGTGVPVPPCVALCEDPSVIGTNFFVMTRVPGRILWDPRLPGFAPSDRRALYEDMFDVLARLHAVAPASAGLEDFGRPGNYFSRQIARWTQQYEAARTEDTPAMTSLAAWLPAHVPPGDDTAIVHGDFRLDNLIVDPDHPRVVAVIDWELATLGHPLSDLAYACLAYYITPKGERRRGETALADDGIPPLDACVARYAERTGRDARPHWPFLVAFALFRLASIAQGVYARGLQGNASSTEALGYRDTARSLAELAWDVVSGTS